MTRVVITIEGDDLEIGEAMLSLARLAEELGNQGFVASEYEVSLGQSTLTIVGRSMQ